MKEDWRSDVKYRRWQPLMRFCTNYKYIWCLYTCKKSHIMRRYYFNVYYFNSLRRTKCDARFTWTIVTYYYDVLLWHCHLWALVKAYITYLLFLCIKSLNVTQNIDVWQKSYWQKIRLHYAFFISFMFVY